MNKKNDIWNKKNKESQMWIEYDLLDDEMHQKGIINPSCIEQLILQDEHVYITNLVFEYNGEYASDIYYAFKRALLGHITEIEKLGYIQPLKNNYHNKSLD